MVSVQATTKTRPKIKLIKNTIGMMVFIRIFLLYVIFPYFNQEEVKTQDHNLPEHTESIVYWYMLELPLIVVFALFNVIGFHLQSLYPSLIITFISFMSMINVEMSTFYVFHVVIEAILTGSFAYYAYLIKTKPASQCPCWCCVSSN